MTWEIKLVSVFNSAHTLRFNWSTWEEAQ